MLQKQTPITKPRHAFLLEVGTQLHRHGTPSHRLERLVSETADNLGIDGACLYTPTSLLVSLTDEDGEATYLRRVDSGQVDVDKLIRFDETLEKVEAGSLSIADATEQLTEIASSKPPFSNWLTIFACAVSCGAVAVFFRGTMAEIIASAVIGLIVALLELVPVKLKWDQGLLEPLAGFSAAFCALAVANFLVPIDDRLVTLAALIVMVPGLKITVALTELAVGHLSAGVARLAGAMVSLLTMTVGVAICWRLFASWRNIPEPLDAAVLQSMIWWQWVAILISPIAFAIIFRARWPQWPIISVVAVLGFVSSLVAGEYFGVEVAAACGALAVGCGSNLYARLRDRPSLVPLTPGILVLVPGSLGYRSLTAFLDNDTMAGIDLAFGMLIVAVGLVGGLLTANAIVPPRRIL